MNSLWVEKGPWTRPASTSAKLSASWASMMRALRGRVLVVCRLGLGMDADHAAGDLKFDLLAARKASLPAHGQRDY